MLAHTLRAEIVKTAQDLERAGLLSLTAGNVSARVSDELMAITPTGMRYGDIEATDIVICDLDGVVIDGARRPSSELPFHSAILKARSDIGAVVHTHSLYATTVAVLGQPIPAVHYVIAALDTASVPVVPYRTFGSPELAEGIMAAVGESGKAALLANHGALALGDDLADAARSAELLEFLATVYHRALAVGEPVILGSEEIDKVRGRYQDYGQPAASAEAGG